MGWCSGTEVFDKVAGAILNSNTGSGSIRYSVYFGRIFVGYGLGLSIRERVLGSSYRSEGV